MAVPGGRAVFDLVLAHGFDGFHLTRAHGVRIAGGIPLFSGVRQTRSPEDVLRAHGLVPGPGTVIDPAAGVSTAFWSRQPMSAA